MRTDFSVCRFLLCGCVLTVRSGSARFGKGEPILRWRLWSVCALRGSLQEVVKDDMDRLSSLRRELAKCLGPQRYELWLGEQVSISLASSETPASSPVETASAAVLRVGCPTQFQMEWLRRKLHKPLQACCRQVWQREVSILFHVETAAAAEVAATVETTVTDSTTAPATDSIGVLPTAEPRQPTRNDRPVRPVSANRRPPRNRQASFATFVVGGGNELAHGTAKVVAEQPGRYCPLLLHGPSGVGKSHLLGAVRQQIRRQTPRANVVGLTSEHFTTQFLEALDRRTLPSFRQKYRTVDVLLVDDIQFLAGKRATLEEMLYTIDTLHDRGSQIVLASDRSPGDLQAVSPELVSRISSGLAVPIDLPDYNTRAGILRNLAVRMQIELDEQVVAMIAAQVSGSARQLSGALNRLLAGSMALGKPITPELAEPALAEFAQQNAPAVRLPDIQRAVCEVFGVEPSSLKSNRKSRTVTEPRMLAMWLARKYTRAALSEISDFFGRRSHSTVISAQKKVESLLRESTEITVADRPCHMDEAIRRVEAAMRSA